MRNQTESDSTGSLEFRLPTRNLRHARIIGLLCVSYLLAVVSFASELAWWGPGEVAISALILGPWDLSHDRLEVEIMRVFLFVVFVCIPFDKLQSNYYKEKNLQPEKRFIGAENWSVLKRIGICLRFAVSTPFTLAFPIIFFLPTFAYNLWILSMYRKYQKKGDDPAPYIQETGFMVVSTAVLGTFLASIAIGLIFEIM